MFVENNGAFREIWQGFRVKPLNTIQAPIL